MAAAAAALPWITAATGIVGAYSALKGARQKTPEIQKPPTVPVVDDKRRKLASERKMMQRYGGKGRVSTILQDRSGLG